MIEEETIQSLSKKDLLQHLLTIEQRSAHREEEAVSSVLAGLKKEVSNKILKLDRLEFKLDKLDKLDTLESKLDKLDRLEDKLVKLDRLEDKLDKLDKLELKLDKLDTVEVKLDKLDKLELKLDKLDKLELKLDKLDKIELKLERFDKLEDKLDKLDKLDQLDDSLESTVDKLEDKLDKLDNLDVHLKESIAATAAIEQQEYITQDIIKSTLSDHKNDLSDKIVNIAKYILHQKSDIEAIQQEVNGMPVKIVGMTGALLIVAGAITAFCVFTLPVADFSNFF
jgi:hypothetical protein